MLICIEALTFGLSRLVQAVQQHGQKLLLLSRDLDVYAYELAQLEKLSSAHFEAIVVDTFNPSAVEAALAPFQDQINGVLNLTDTWSLPSLALAEKLNLPHQNTASVHLCRNKFALRNHLFEAGLSSSPSLLYQAGDPLPALDALRFPLIVKDIAGTASANVWTVRDRAALEALLAKIDYASLRGGSVLIESQFNGTLYSAESVTYQGETKVYAITSRILSPEPYFREEFGALPVQFPLERQQAIVAWVQKVLRCVGYDHGMSHLEFMITPEGFEVIEINPRCAGAQVTEAACQAYGYNFLLADVELSLGLRPGVLDTELSVHQGVACACLYGEETGVFSHIEGLERLPLATGNIAFYPTAKPGKLIHNTHNQSANVGLLLAHGESSEQALLNGAAALGRLKAVTKT